MENGLPDDQGRRVKWGVDRVHSYTPPPSQFDSTESNTNNVQEEEDDESDSVGEWNALENDIILAITASKGRVGCCYYNGSQGKVHFMEDTNDSVENWDLVQSLLEQVSPTMVITNANADPTFLTMLESTLSTLSASTPRSSSHQDTPIQLEHRPSRDFYPAKGQEALSQLNVIEEGMYAGADVDEGDNDVENEVRDAYDFGTNRRQPGAQQNGDDRGRRNNQLRLGSFFCALDASGLTLGCAGALLSHLTREFSLHGELDVDGSLTVYGLELIEMETVMHINLDSLISLQIFDPETHGSIYSDRKKEGLSLFAIMNVARTPPGRALMKQWFLRPLLDFKAIESRQNAVTCFIRSENQHIAEAIQSHFRSIKNARKTLSALSSGRGSLADWRAMWEFLFGSVMIGDAILSFSEKNVEILQKVLGSFDGVAFKELGNMINDIIDWDESMIQKGRLCVKSGVSEDLDALTRNYHGLPSLLSNIATEISKTIPPHFATSISVVYFPQLGYLIALPFREELRAPEELLVDGWDYQFVTEESVYFKNDKCRDLDQHLGDIRSFITDKEIEILHALLQSLLPQSASICAAAAAFAELDCLLAFAESARCYDWNKPLMTDENVCKIKQGRHPLVELCVDSYVKNDICLVGGRGLGWDSDEMSIESEADVEDEYLHSDRSMIIVTGANYSGKSIFLKQTAILTFMAHLGSFIPAEAALIGLTDKILTRISTRESVTLGSSAFMIDLQQISFALRNATARSLIVIDEFGKGTDSDDGAGLFCGVVEHLMRRGSEAPRVAIATHFSDVFSNKLLSPSLPISLAHMEVLLTRSTSNTATSSASDSSRFTGSSRDQVTYLYRLCPGLATTSHAAACAALFGIDTTIIARAEEVSDLLARFEMGKLTNCDHDDKLSITKKNELEAAERLARRFLEWDLTAEEDEEEEGEDDFETLMEKLNALVSRDD